MKNGFKPIFIAMIMALICVGCDNEMTYTEPVIPEVTDDGNEPPQNSFLADSPWPMTHRNPYGQASSPYPGPERQGDISYKNFLPGGLGLITIAISGQYPDGSYVLWGNNMDTVFKIDNNGTDLSYISRLSKYKSLKLSRYGRYASLLEKGKSGAYTLVDRDGLFFMPYFTRIYCIGDITPGDSTSAIEVKGEFEIPAENLHGEDDYLVGMNLTYDGMIAFATSRGTVGVVTRNFDQAYYLNLGDDEEVSNSIAVCEKNGIYVVTSNKMYRVQWTGSILTLDASMGGWVADYETGEDASGIRLGSGSGSTPSLMGIDYQDKFVVITDGQPLMHLLLMWRDEIPGDWEKIPGTKDRRIAAQVPVTFGDPAATQSLSEQSVCVRGYGALVVNNQMAMDSGNGAINIFFSGCPGIAPYGVEKFVWNETTRALKSVWVNDTISLPNGIPSMSSTTNLIYDMGQRSNGWTLEAIDWETGASVFHRKIGFDMKFNSTYAATEIGYNGRLISGTLFGTLLMLP